MSDVVIRDDFNLAEPEDKYVFRGTPPGSFWEQKKLAKQLEVTIYNLLKGHVFVKVKFGFRARHLGGIPVEDGTPCFNVKLNKNHGEAQEDWGVDFAYKCAASRYELETAVRRIMKAFEQTEKAQLIQNNDKIEIEGEKP